MPIQYNTPGVYVTEINAFSNSVVAVPTAVPAFIGYTAQANYKGKSLINTAVKITSLAEFMKIFAFTEDDSRTTPTKQYHPEYYLAKTDEPVNVNSIVIHKINYNLLPDASTIYYLYNSIRLFYLNGGTVAYIISVGTFGAPSKKAIDAEQQIANPNVQLKDLLTGVAILEKESEPALYLCPDATLLSLSENATFMQALLQMNLKTQRAISLFDVIGGDNIKASARNNNIENFRNNVGSTALNYAAAYYPFLKSTILQNNDLNYLSLMGGDVKALQALLNPVDNFNEKIAAVFSMIENSATDENSMVQNHQSLLAVSPEYRNIIDAAIHKANVIPASGAVAGAISLVDSLIGVFKAPANVSLHSVVAPCISINNEEQGSLNIDDSAGKSINVIRNFPGKGTLIWGARTLDGNSQDWRYLSVRRTAIMIEQSIKQACNAYVFEANDANTWTTVTSVISNFLNSLWQQGALVGACAADAFSVTCGLGSTMTADDILNGTMNISVRVALSHPAEFIVLTFQQQMQKP